MVARWISVKLSFALVIIVPAVLLEGSSLCAKCAYSPQGGERAPSPEILAKCSEAGKKLAMEALMAAAESLK